MVKFFQLAHHLSASSFQLIVGLTRNTVTFPCASARIHELRELPSILLQGNKPTDILLHLLTGLRTALSHHRKVVCSLGDRAFLCLDPKGVDWYGWPSISVESRPRLAVTFFRKSWTQGVKEIFLRASEHQSLERRVAFSTIPVRVDGRQVSRGWPSDGHNSEQVNLLEAYLNSSTGLPSFDFYDYSKQKFSSSGDGFWTWQCKNLSEWQGDHTPTQHRLLLCPKRGRALSCGLALRVGSHLSHKSGLTFMLGGVRSETKQLDLGLPGSDILVSGAGLTTDLSEFQVVEDKLYHQRLEAVTRELKFLPELLRKLGQN